MEYQFRTFLTRRLDVVLPIAILLLTSVTAIPVMAQIKSGTITGLVTDESGALVPDAQVSVINEDTRVANSAKSDAGGTFVIPYLEPGHYAVRAEKQGFSNFN